MAETPPPAPTSDPLQPSAGRASGGLTIRIVPEASLAQHGAEVVAEAIVAGVRTRGRAAVAFSGGSTAPSLLEALAPMDLPWAALDVFQVDERVAPLHDAARNLTALRRTLVAEGRLPNQALHALPVDESPLAAAAARYGQLMRSLVGDPIVFDLVHLGLGSDGHTASLIPDAPDLLTCTEPVAVTPVYQGHHRLTLTPGVLSSSRRVLWFVNGESKASAVARLVRADGSIPASRVERSRAVLLLDDAAAGALQR